MASLPPIPDPNSAPRESLFAALWSLFTKAAKFGRDWYGAFHILTFVIAVLIILALNIKTMNFGVKLPDGSTIDYPWYKPVVTFLLILGAFSLARGVWLFLGGIINTLMPPSENENNSHQFED